jgi:NADH-quinone oxidoreductase subunit G
MNRCIACYRCVRYYQDYCGGHDLQVFGAHNHVYFGRQEDGALDNEFSGNLVEVCPTGVFTDKTFSKHYTRKWDLQSAPSVCPHCALGCNTSPGERYGVLRRVVNRYHGEVNGYFLCDRGRFGYDFVNGAARLRQSRIRNQPPLGVKGLANLFGQIVRNARGLIGIGSPRASLEANFALRELVGPEHFFLGVADSVHAMLRNIANLLQYGPLRTASLREAEQADAVLVLGEDVSNTAPRLALALRQAVRAGQFAAADRLRIPRWQDAAVRTVGQGMTHPLFIASYAPTRLDDIAAGMLRGGPEAIASLALAVAGHLAETGAPGEAAAEPDLAGRIAAALLAAERPLIVCGTGCGSAAVVAAAGRIAAILAERRQGRPTAVHFALPECNSLGLALLGGGPLSAAFAAVEEGRADSVVVLENDLYRHAPKTAVDAFLARAVHSVVLDQVRHATADQAELALAASAYAESEGTWISSEGRAQRHFQVFAPAETIRPSWCWLAEAGALPWPDIDTVTAACAAALPAFSAIPAAAPAAGFRLAGRKIPRQPHRYSGRTAMLAQVSVHEPKQRVDQESALAFSMEGALGSHPPALNPFSWAPGWNSCQSVNQFQEEIGGHLAGGDPGVRLIEPAAVSNGPTAGSVATAAADAGSTGDSVTSVLVESQEEQAPNRWRFVPLHHVFGGDELSALAPAIAERAPAPFLAVSPEDAARAGLEAGQEVPVATQGAIFRLPIRILPGLASGLAGIPAGLPGLAWAEFEGGWWEYPP